MDELAKRFADIAAQYAPQVIDAAKQSVVISCYQTLLFTALWLIIGCALIKTSTIFWRNRTDLNMAEIPTGISIIVGLIAIVICCMVLINPWTWIALNHPELYIAHSFLNL
jgi:CHASE2 domain-containing sensor protein